MSRVFNEFRSQLSTGTSKCQYLEGSQHSSYIFLNVKAPVATIISPGSKRFKKPVLTVKCLSLILPYTPSRRNQTGDCWQYVYVYTVTKQLICMATRFGGVSTFISKQSHGYNFNTIEWHNFLQLLQSGYFISHSNLVVVKSNVS